VDSKREPKVKLNSKKQKLKEKEKPLKNSRLDRSTYLNSLIIIYIFIIVDK
jgi:hypothetical protein